MGCFEGNPATRWLSRFGVFQTPSHQSHVVEMMGFLNPILELAPRAPPAL